jgi:hypothetical protein
VITARRIAGVHAAYYVTTGVWSIVHRRSFERVTGPKRDYWLVRTVGALAAAIGSVLGYAAAVDRQHRETRLLAAASALSFGFADVQAARAASRIYLADALFHVLLVAGWWRASRTGS